jgi:iron complex outermembrane receptor protein
LPDQFFEAFPTGPLPLPPCPGTGLPCQVGDRVLPFVEESTSAEEWTPALNLAYSWNDALMTYISYSEGFKGGGFTQRIFPPEATLPDFAPEFVTSYEAGIKFDGWDGRLRLNGAIFYADYTDIQLLVADPTRVGPFVTNAGDAEIKGIELEMLLAPAEGWLISGSVGYLDPERTKVGTGVQGLTLDSRFENISDVNINLQIIKEIPIGNMGRLAPRLEWVYRSKYGTNANNVPYDGPQPAPPFLGSPDLGFGIPNPAQLQPSYSVFHASLRWDVTDSGFAVTAGVENIGDKLFRTFGNQQDAFGFTTEIFDRGRQWYLEGSYEF